jgi:hypothetical protein
MGVANTMRVTASTSYLHARHSGTPSDAPHSPANSSSVLRERRLLQHCELDPCRNDQFAHLAKVSRDCLDTTPASCEPLRRHRDVSSAARQSGRAAEPQHGRSPHSQTLAGRKVGPGPTCYLTPWRAAHAAPTCCTRSANEHPPKADSTLRVQRRVVPHKPHQRECHLLRLRSDEHSTGRLGRGGAV